MKPTTFKFSEMIISVGDGGSPETFGNPCGLTTKSFNGQANTNDTNVPDCDDPEAASWLERDVVSLTRDISGSGVLADEFLGTWDDWFVSANSRNARIHIGDFQWSGAYLLTAFQITANLGNKVEISVTLSSDGEITRSIVSN